MLTKITNLTIYDGRGGKTEHAALLFDESGILGYGRDEAFAPCEREIDGAGLTCLPGLINAHGHIQLDGKPSMVAQLAEDNSEALALNSAYRNCLRSIAAGFITIRDLGTAFNASVTMRNLINSGKMFGPNIYTSGKVICMTGGHGNGFGIEADGPEGTRKAARQQIKAGVNVLKVMATGGGQSPGMKAGATQLSEIEIRSICEEAKNVGLHTSAHAQGKEGIMNCLRAGVDSIEHGVYLDEEIIETMLRQGSYFCATLLSPYYTVLYGEAAGVPRYAVEKCKGQVEAHFKSFELACRSGIKIMAGNDAGTPFNTLDDMPNELRKMTELGMSVRDVITSTTYTPAECMHVQDIIGSIEKGKHADLTIIEGDPEIDIEAFKQVRYVYKNGTLMYSNLGGDSRFYL